MKWQLLCDYWKNCTKIVLIAVCNYSMGQVRRCILYFEFISLSLFFWESFFEQTNYFIEKSFYLLELHVIFMCVKSLISIFLTRKYREFSSDIIRSSSVFNCINWMILLSVDYLSILSALYCIHWFTWNIEFSQSGFSRYFWNRINCVQQLHDDKPPVEVLRKGVPTIFFVFYVVEDLYSSSTCKNYIFKNDPFLIFGLENCLESKAVCDYI